MTNESKEKPISWKIVQPSGNVIFVEHELIVDMLNHEMPNREPTVDAVCTLYRTNEATPLYDNTAV